MKSADAEKIQIPCLSRAKNERENESDSGLGQPFKRYSCQSTTLEHCNIQIKNKMADIMESISLMTVVELQAELKRRGLKKSGNKAVLIQRLKEVNNKLIFALKFSDFSCACVLLKKSLKIFINFLLSGFCFVLNTNCKPSVK